MHAAHSLLLLLFNVIEGIYMVIQILITFMFKHMTFKSLFSREFSTTKRTWIWLFSSVGILMRFSVALVIEPFVTIRAFEWFFSCMGSLMLYDTIPLGKLFVTIRAFEWFFSCVGSLVPFNMTLISKLFVAV